MKIQISIEGATKEQLEKYTEIFTVLLAKGALDGVKGGKAILHFDADSQFMGVELDYWPWRRRK